MKFSTVDPFLEARQEDDVIVLGELTIHYLYVPGVIPLSHFRDVTPVQEYLLRNPPLDDNHQLLMRVLLDAQGAVMAAVMAFDISDEDWRKQREIICFLSDFIPDLGQFILPLVIRECEAAQGKLREAAIALSMTQTTFATLNTLRERMTHG